MSTFTALNGGSPRLKEASNTKKEKSPTPEEATTSLNQSSQRRGSSPRRSSSWGTQGPDRQPEYQPRDHSEVDLSHKRKRSGSAEVRRERSLQERTPDTATTPSRPLPHDYYFSPHNGSRDGRNDFRQGAHQHRDEHGIAEKQKAHVSHTQNQELPDHNSRRGSSKPADHGDDPSQSSDAEERSITVYTYPSDSRQDGILQHDPKKRKRNFSNRTKTGCLTCRKRKKKCDEEKPECSNCIRGGFVCAGYPPQRGASWHKPESKTPAVPLESKDPSYVPPGAYGMPLPSSYSSQNSYGPQPPKRDPPSHYRGGSLRIDPPQGRPLVTDDDRLTASTMPSSVASPENKLSALPYPAANAFPTPISANTQPPSFGERMAKEYRVPPLHDLSRQEPETPQRQSGSQLPQINLLHPNRASSPAIQHAASSAQVAQLALSHQFPQPQQQKPQHQQHQPHQPHQQQNRPKKEEMRSGRQFYPFDKELCLERERCATACWRFNNLTSPVSIGVSAEERARLFLDILAPRELVQMAVNDVSPEASVGRVGRHVAVETPFTCDYGYNIMIGNAVSIGRNCHINDVCHVNIGDNCVIGPNVSIYTANLPIDPKIRQNGQGPQFGRPVTIEPDCWIGGGAIILPGRTIGKGSTVGAGSIVTKDVPRFTVVAGNPARVLRGIAS